MEATSSFYESLETQQKFLRQLAELNPERISELIGRLRDFIHEDESRGFRAIYGVGEGRTALSLYDFLQQLLRYKGISPATLDDPIRRYFNVKENTLVLVASGSGETESVIAYLEEAIKVKVPIILITASAKSRAYKLVKKYEGGYVFVIKNLKHRSKSHLSVMGSEFELKLCVFLNSLLPALESANEKYCLALYREQLRHFQKNASLLQTIDKKHLYRWTEKLLNRRGNYVLDGIGRSGFVAGAFGMRLTHLGRLVFLHDAPNTPSFARGDAYIPISGSGNTKEIVFGVKSAHTKGADIFPITVNKKSKIAELMASWGYKDNIIFVPLAEEDTGLYKSRKPSKITAAEATQKRPSYSEINFHIFVNAFIALAIDYLGLTEKFMKRIHP